TDLIHFSIPKERMTLPVAASQSFRFPLLPLFVACPLLDSTRVPSGENATALIRYGFLKVRSRRPEARSQSVIALPSPIKTRPLSGENPTELTISECPSNVRSKAPVAMSHNFSVES